MQALLGFIRLQQGRPEPARVRLAAAVLILEQALGTEHVEMMAPLSKLAEAERQLGRFEEALAHAERALSLARSHGLGPAVQGSLHRALAFVRWDQGDRVGAWADAELAQDAYATLEPAEREGLAEFIEGLHRWQQEHPAPE